MPLLWKPELSVNVKEIDEQHKRFVDIMNRLYDVISSKETASIDEVLKELEEYARIHFSTEEKYFDMFKFPGADEHKEEHKKFLEKIKYFIENSNNDRMGISFEVADYLEDWLVHHLDAQDKKYVKCFNENGLF